MWKEDYYALFGISRNATPDEIKKAYKKFMEYYHPDKKNVEEDVCKCMSQLGNEAYEVLSNKKGKKAEYDAWYDKQQEIKLEEELKNARKRAVEQENEKKRKAKEEEAAKKAKEREEKRQQRKANKNKGSKKDDSKEKNNTNTMSSFNKSFRDFQLNKKGRGGKLAKKIAFTTVATVAATGIIIYIGTGMYNTNRPKPKDDNIKPPYIDQEKSSTETKNDEVSTPAVDQEKSDAKNNTDEIKTPVENAINSTNDNDIQTENTKNDNDIVTAPIDKAQPIDETQNSSNIPVEQVEQIEVDENVNIIYSNWSKMTDKYSQETIKEVMNCLYGKSSIYTIEEVDGIITDIVNEAIVPAVNNRILQAQGLGISAKTFELDLSSFILDGTTGQKAVENMEDYLNGAMTNDENLEQYITAAFTDEARILGEDETVDGLNIEDTSTPAAVKLIWAKLAQAVNAIAGTIDNPFTVEVNGNTYTQEELNDFAVLENIITTAKKELGYNPKTMNLN